jgi:hypothetical protein
MKIASLLFVSTRQEKERKKQQIKRRYLLLANQLNKNTESRYRD